MTSKEKKVAEQSRKKANWLVKRVGQLKREEGNLMTSEERREAEQRRRKADEK
jgi:hypothetical protein